MHNDISRSNDREYRWYFYRNAHISSNLALLFLFLHIGICLRSSLTQGWVGGRGEVCAWQESRSPRRDHVEAPSNGMEPGAAFNQGVKFSLRRAIYYVLL